MVHLLTFSCGYPTGVFRFPRNTYRPQYCSSSDCGKRDNHPQIAYIYGDGIEDGFRVSRNPVCNIDRVYVLETGEWAEYWRFDTQSLWSDDLEIRLVLFNCETFDPSTEVIFV